MATYVAADITGEKLTLVTADTNAQGSIVIRGVTHYMLRDLMAVPEEGDQEFPDTRAENGSAASEENNESASNGTHRHRLEDLVNVEQVEIDACFATMNRSRLLFESLQLPFRDKRRLLQIVPLQLQDYVPFDMGDFVTDSIVVGSDDNGQFSILTCLAPQEDIAETLQQLSLVGADPKVLAPRSSAIAALVRLCPDVLRGNFALLVFSDKSCSAALFVNDTIVELRDYFMLPSQSPDQYRATVLADLHRVLAATEHHLTQQIDRCFAVGSPDVIDFFGAEFSRPIVSLDLTDYVGKEATVPYSVNDYAWALGLFAAEANISPTPNAPHVLDLRRGPFSYKPSWGSFLTALKDELFYVILALLLGLSYFGLSLYRYQYELSEIDKAISSEIQQVLPGQIVPKNQELIELQRLVSQNEEELEGLGSIAPISPLDTLTALTNAIGEIDTKIDSLSINVSNCSMDFRGSVPDILSANSLEHALQAAVRENGRFLDVKFQRQKIASQSRVRFDVTLVLCEQNKEE